MSSQTRTLQPGLEIGILLNLAFGVFKEALHAELATHGFGDLGASFGYVLRVLEPQDEGMSLKDLAAALGVTPQGTLKIADDMVAKGYVSRHPDPRDSRVKRLRVADRGAQLLFHARAFHIEFEERLSARCGTASVESMRRCLESLIEPSSVERTIRMQIL